MSVTANAELLRGHGEMARMNEVIKGSFPRRRKCLVETRRGKGSTPNPRLPVKTPPPHSTTGTITHRLGT